MQDEVKRSKQLGATAVSWSVGLVCLRMHGVPPALGCSAYLSVWREVWALCVERLAIFVPSLPHPLLSTVTGACLLFHCDGCLSMWRVLSSQGHGWVVRFCQPLVRSLSWSWLPIVVAPGCLGLPTSTDSERRSFLRMFLLHSLNLANSHGVISLLEDWLHA